MTAKGHAASSRLEQAIALGRNFDPLEINMLLAERDRLKAVNAELVTALGILNRDASNLLDHPSAQSAKIRLRMAMSAARAAIAKASGET